MMGCGVDAITCQGDGGDGCDESLTATHPAIWRPTIDIAGILAERHGIRRQAQDGFALPSQQRMAAAREAGEFRDEFIPGRSRARTAATSTAGPSPLAHPWA